MLLQIGSHVVDAYDQQPDNLECETAIDKPSEMYSAFGKVIVKMLKKLAKKKYMQ